GQVGSGRSFLPALARLSRRSRRRCCRKRLWRIAMRVEERDHVGAVLWIAEAGESHLCARREGSRAGQPLAEIVPVPAAALLRQRVRECEALALTDRLSDHVPQVRAKLVRAALVGIVAGRALVEDLLAFRGIGLGKIGLDRLLGGGTALAFLGDALDRVAHGFRTLAVEHLTRDDRRAERDNAREQDPAGDCIGAIVHEFSLVFPEEEKNGFAAL